jgi:hypothetical protein
MLLEINWTDIAYHLFVYDPKRPLLFNSAAFLVLFLVVYGLFIPMRRATTLRTLYLLAFSIFFYYKSSGLFFILLLVSTAWNFGLGHLMYTATFPSQAGFFTCCSALVGSLGLLGLLQIHQLFYWECQCARRNGICFSEDISPGRHFVFYVSNPELHDRRLPGGFEAHFGRSADVWATGCAAWRTSLSMSAFSRSWWPGPSFVHRILSRKFASRWG